MDKTRGTKASPDNHVLPKRGRWGMYRFSQRDVERLGWRGKAGLLANLDRWLTKCKPDSMDDIHAIWLETPFQNFVATIYCKSGRGQLARRSSIVTIDIPWRDPDDQKKSDPNEELLLLLKDATMRIIGVYYGAGSHTLYLTTAGAKASDVRKKIMHMWAQR